ncbi:hypothetical protein R6Q59_002533 [Mikania micrantha]
MDTGFHYGRTLGSAMNRHAISFKSSATDNTPEMIVVGDYCQMNTAATTSTQILGTSAMANNNSGFTQPGNSCDSVLGLKHDTGLAVEWSVDEQRKLEEGLSKFADEPSIMKYIKIAAMLHDKTVRDVALRCRWIAKKRRKQDELHMGKKLKDKKDNLAESSSKQSILSGPTSNVAPFSVTMNNRIQIDSITFEALSGSIRHLIEQNNQVLCQISANISLLKQLQDNINLFNHMKNNITTILNDMRYMPGPPFPVSLNEDLAHSILPTTNQRFMFEASSGMNMKQEPGFN